MTEFEVLVRRVEQLERHQSRVIGILEKVSQSHGALVETVRRIWQILNWRRDT